MSQHDGSQDRHKNGFEQRRSSESCHSPSSHQPLVYSNYHSPSYHQPLVYSNYHSPSSHQPLVYYNSKYEGRSNQPSLMHFSDSIAGSTFNVIPPQKSQTSSGDYYKDLKPPASYHASPPQSGCYVDRQKVQINSHIDERCTIKEPLQVTNYRQRRQPAPFKDYQGDGENNFSFQSPQVHHKNNSKAQQRMSACYENKDNIGPQERLEHPADTRSYSRKMSTAEDDNPSDGLSSSCNQPHPHVSHSDKHLSGPNSRSYERRSELRAEKGPAQKDERSYKPSNKSKTPSKGGDSSIQSDIYKESQCDLRRNHVTKHLNEDSENISKRSEVQPYHKQKNVARVCKPHKNDAKSVTKIPFERENSISSQGSEKSTVSEMSATAKRFESKSKRRSRQPRQNNLEKCTSMPDIKKQGNACSLEEMRNGTRVCLQTATSCSHYNAKATGKTKKDCITKKQFDIATKLQDVHIHSSVVNGNADRGQDLSSKIHQMQADIKRAKEEITRKTQRTLEVHKEKMKAYEKALDKIKTSTNTKEVDDEDNDCYEEAALFDKLTEVCKQAETFSLRRNEFIEKVNKYEPLTTNSKELSDFLRSVGVECERLKAALPIYARREDIVKKISENQVSIILGETGSGKSTQLAQYIYESGVAGKGVIVCTQPRKVAAVTLAERVAKEMAGMAGGLVGYKIGLRKKLSENTKILFTTDHSLLNECVVDSKLSKYTCIIVDEAHERSIYTDLLLGMIKACMPQRPDLKVIITSATIDPKLFVQYFDTTPELKVSGRTFPVDVFYSDCGTSQEFENFELKALEKAVDVHINEEPGDILVFLTATVEIMRCCEEFQQRMAGRHDYKCIPLHGQLPPEEQKRAFEKLPEGIRKIVFATNCAETSITIDGIKYVIDSGVAKEMQYDSKRNICILGTGVISKSSADQRKGRAGRTQSGKCFRLYSEEAYKTMKEFTEPEILRIPLGQSLLKLAELGVDVKTYDFVQSPSKEAIDSALKTLKELGALNSEGITDAGLWISKLPFHPKEGFLVYHGNLKNLLFDSVVMASLIANGSNLFYRGFTESEKQATAKSKSYFASHNGDVFTWMDVYKNWLQVPKNKKSSWCKEKGINYKGMNYTKQCVEEVVAVLKKEHKINLELKFSLEECAQDVLRKIIFDANLASVSHYLGHVKAGYHALLADRRVHLHPSTILFSHNTQPEWIVYLEFTKTSKDFIKGITIVEESWVQEAVQEGKLCVDIKVAKKMKIELVHREMVGSSVFRKLVGEKYSHLRVWEDELTNSGMKTVVVEVDRDLGLLDIFSTSPMDQDVAHKITTVKKEVIKVLESGEGEIAVLKKTGNEPSGVRVILGQGGCVKSLLMPNQSNKILIKMSSHRFTEDQIRAKFSLYGEIKECVRFKRDNPWGFVRYSSFSEAKAAVEDTRNDEENVAVLKIDKQFNNMVSRFEARLSWCRRSIKGKGTAFIKCPSIEMARLIGKYICLPSGIVELKVSNKGDDLICFNTGRAQEIDIKRAVMDILDNDESLEKGIRVNVLREQAEPPSDREQNGLKNYLLDKFSCYVAKEKFKVNLMPVQKNSLNQIAFVHFESPIDGFHVCERLQSRLTVKGQPVEIKLQLKTTIHVRGNIMKACESRFDKIISGLKEYKETHVQIRPLKQGDFAFDVQSERVKYMVEARELLQREIEGEIIDCGVNDLTRKLIRQQGKEFLRKMESKCDVLIVINDRKEKVHIYGNEANVTKTKLEVNRHLEKLASGKQVDVILKGKDKPPGLMKELLKKYNNLQDDFTGQFALSDVEIDFRQQKFSLFGPEECVNRALSFISELESSILLSGTPKTEKWMPDCVSCMCPVENSSSIYRLEACGHSYCFACLKIQMSVYIQDKKFPIVCALEGCETPLMWKDFSFCMQKRWTSEEKLIDKSVSAFVAANQDKFRFCLTPECSIIYEVTAHEVGAEFVCPSCLVSVCTSCHTAYHSGLTCKMVSVQEEAVKKWIMENPLQRKVCPECKVGVEKIDGCNKMHCLACHTCFCWVCLKICENEQKCYAHLQKEHGSFI